MPKYKPVVYTPKKYTPVPISFPRPKPRRAEIVEEVADDGKVETKIVEVKDEKPKKRTYSGYDSDNKKYLRTYRNRYSGTPTKPHSHQSCLQRMLSRFSKYNNAMRKRRAARIASQRNRQH